MKMVSKIAGMVITGVVLMCSVALGEATTYPNRTIKIVHLYAPGGGNDTVARLIGERLSAQWPKGVIVEPRPGGGGIVGSEAVVHAPPDGHTLLLASDALPIMPSILKLHFDVPGSFAPIMKLGSVPFILVAAKEAPFRSLQEMIAYARAHPGTLSYSSVGVGSPHHLAMELLKDSFEIDLVHIPYSGGAPQMQDMIAGRVPVGFSSLAAAISLIEAGLVRPLAIASTHRSPRLPDVPTVQESGAPDFEIEGWYGLLAPAGTPTEIVQRIQLAVSNVLSDPPTREKLTAQGIAPTAESGPASFTALLSREVLLWRAILAKQKRPLK
jgi:tripartite-type tricarboxylate transporter receptor subunit TctC